MGKGAVPYDLADKREDEMVRGFNEVLEVIEKYLNPSASMVSNLPTGSKATLIGSNSMGNS